MEVRDDVTNLREYATRKYLLRMTDLLRDLSCQAAHLHGEVKELRQVLAASSKEAANQKTAS